MTSFTGLAALQACDALQTARRFIAVTVLKLRRGAAVCYQGVVAFSKQGAIEPKQGKRCEAISTL